MGTLLSVNCMGSHYWALIESQNMVIMFENSGDHNGSTQAPRTPDILKRKFKLSYFYFFVHFLMEKHGMEQNEIFRLYT